MSSPTTATVLNASNTSNTNNNNNNNNSEIDENVLETDGKNEVLDKRVIKSEKKISSNDTLRLKFFRNSNFWRLSQIFSSMAKPNVSTNSEPKVPLSSESQLSQYPQQQPQQPPYPGLPDPQYRQPAPVPAPTVSTSICLSSCSPQISSSATSGFLPQKLTQPLTALLKQKSEHKNSINSISQFFIHFKGAEWRAEQLHYQMPAHDLQMLKSQTTEVKFVRNQQRKAQIKPQLFQNKSLNYCFKCTNALEIGSYGVKISVVKNGNHNNGYSTTTDDEDNTALKSNSSDLTHPTLNGSTALYHIQCFTCEECQQVLVDLKAFLYTNSESNDRSKVNNSLYCSRHFVELYKPRCRFCDHLIFDEECTEAEGEAWHLGHFCCTECKRSLGGQQYIMANPSKQIDKKSIYETKSQSIGSNRDKKQLPYCLTCFDILFGELCEECGELIGCDVGAISHEGRSWHARDACFKCNFCSKALLGKPFLPAFDGRIYCSITCSQEAIQRNRHRDRRKPREVTTSTQNDINCNNNLLKQLDKTRNNCQTDGQIPKQMKPKLQMRRPFEQIYGQKPLGDNYRLPVTGLSTNALPVRTSPNNVLAVNRHHNNEEVNGFTKKLSEVKLNETTNIGEFETQKQNDFIISIEDHVYPNSTNVNQNTANTSNVLLNQQMFDYIQKYQQLSKAPDYVLEYMKQQLLQNEANRQHLIGATIEYGSSLSEDERTNQQTLEYKTQPLNQINYNQMTSMTSSTSSSLNNPFEPNHSITNPLKYNPSLTHSMSSSSAETTPLLMRTLEERTKQLTQIQNQSQQLVTNKSKLFTEQSLPKSESPSQTSQADQSSSSSYIETTNNHLIDSKVMPDITDVRKTTEADTPSTQSTALQSTSSQTTPETNPRSANKSVTFDPSVKETTGRRMNRKCGFPKSRSIKKSDFNSDNHSCSTCSTCSSSSSSSDENFDYESTLERNRNQWLGGTKIHYVTNDRKKNISNLVPESSASNNNESCSIS